MPVPEERLRAAYERSGLRVPFETAMGDRKFEICLRNMVLAATKRRRA